MSKTLTIKNIIDELRKLGMEVEARKRSDGGYIITKINNMTFSGAKGNQYARQVLGVELSQARIEQTAYNVTKYIKGKKSKTLDEGMKKELRKVQRTWRKNKVGGEAKITAKKVKKHLKEHGREETEAYLRKMNRYGEGYAYEENVEYLAQYVEDVAKGLELTNEDYADKFYKLAEEIRSRSATFQEDWIHKIYEVLYTVFELGFQDSTLEAALSSIYSIIS